MLEIVLVFKRFFIFSIVVVWEGEDWRLCFLSLDMLYIIKVDLCCCFKMFFFVI